MEITHPEERYQTRVLDMYDTKHRDVRYLIQFSDGESYECIFDTAYDSDNIGEIEQETGEEFVDGDPRYDEFYRLEYLIKEIIHDGPRRYEKFLSIDYRDFPSKVTDITNNVQVYPPTDQPADLPKSMS